MEIKEVDKCDPKLVQGVIVSQRQWRRRLFWIAVKSDKLNACVVHPRGILELEDFAIGETKGL